MSGLSAALVVLFILICFTALVPWEPAVRKDQLSGTLQGNVQWTFAQAISSHNSPLLNYEGLFLARVR